ncbi:MAG: Gfo/Idh/MocA family oxidoreductase [Anaerolineales bacterium]|nr:Gfo/Idh/MocA family oxidoreductase [Anaerolineales bacterium]
MKSIKVGVIGVGTMGERHCRVYSSLRNVDLVGAADLNAKRGQAVAAEYDTQYFQDYQQLLDQVDAVSIVTTTPSHFTLAAEALTRSVHVLVEKPITENIDQGAKLVELAEEHGKMLQVGHIERFNPVFLELKNVIKDLPLIAVNIKRLSPFDTSNTDVDVIRDLMIHDLDLVINLLGRNFESLSAWGRSISTKAVDHAVANFSFIGGPVSTLFASRVTEQKVRSIEVIAEGAYIEADLLGKTLLIHRRTFPEYVGKHNAGKYRQESIIEKIHVPMIEPLLLELRHFVECVSGKETCAVPGSDGVFALQLAQSISEQICLSQSFQQNILVSNLPQLTSI